MDAVANDVPGLEVEGFPTILLFPRAASQAASHGASQETSHGQSKHAIEYDGSRDAHDILQFVKDAREGRAHVGGLPDSKGGQAVEEESKVEL